MRLRVRWKWRRLRLGARLAAISGVPMSAAPRPATRDEVPVLDLTPLNRGETLSGLARELRRACETIGFFYIANHGVPQAVVDNVFDATRRYFALPLAHPMKLRLDERLLPGFLPPGYHHHPGYAT